MLCVVLSSCPPDRADLIARALVQSRVAACVSQVRGAVSTYRWEGAVCQEPETLLLIKTPNERLAACTAALRELHPYRVPEIVVLKADDVAASYLAWARAECDVAEADA
ncbi:MAG: divalent-cation tolerance protein CutA [Myxococcales bacterium]|nr:divalent-cation tolerance protein CutA [Myxococcales bacterium]